MCQSAFASVDIWDRRGSVKYSLQWFQGDALVCPNSLSLSREILNSRLHDSVWSLTDWFWCICRFIGGTEQIEVITLSWAKQTPLRDWFIFSCTEGWFKVSFEEKQLSPRGFSMQSSLFYCVFTRSFWKWDTRLWICIAFRLHRVNVFRRCCGWILFFCPKTALDEE